MSSLKSSFAALPIARQQLLQQRAHFMRFNPTPPEAALWRCLRGRRLGVQFRRQVIIGQHIVDFCAPASSLIVEVDGQFHEGQASADAARERKLVRAGYTVLRLPASLVERQLGEAVARVARAL